MDRTNLIPISEQQADKLIAEGVATFFDAPEAGAMGFFEAKKGARQDIIVIVRDDGWFTRAREDLVKSDDGVFVGFVEDGKPPEFEDVFEVRGI